jgi:glycerol-1-phosphate dehydrogenase [NAD(P)+]
MAEIIDNIINENAIPLVVKIEAGLKNHAINLIDGLALGRKFAVVSDKNTHAVLGNSIEKAFDNAVSIIFENGVIPNMEAVERAMVASAGCDAIIAVGSGTINDICKYASFKLGKPYLVWGTAPSMNGYSSANASILVDGHKKTLKAQLPRAIFIDLDIFCAAPKRLIRSGLGDSLCRSTAQADWLLSNLLFGTQYNPVVFQWLTEFEAELFGSSAALLRGDRRVMENLAQTLIISGLGMYICGGSYPASQGEHLIAHTIEVIHPDLAYKTYHGEQIGVTTLTMAKMQQSILEQGQFRLNYTSKGWKKLVEGYFGLEIALHCIEEYEKKALTNQQVDEKNHFIAGNWADIQQKLSRVHINADKLKAVLINAGAYIEPNQLGWPDTIYNSAVSQAKYIRDRFTFLDVN